MSRKKEATTQLREMLGMFGATDGHWGKTVKADIPNIAEFPADEIWLINRFVQNALCAVLEIDPAKPFARAVRDRLEGKDAFFVVERDGSGEITLVVGPGKREDCVNKIVEILNKRHNVSVTVPEVESHLQTVGNASCVTAGEYTVEIVNGICRMSDPLPALS